MSKLSELKTKVEELEQENMAACFMLANEPDFEVSTRRVEGEKYTVRVWFRNNGYHFLSVRYSYTTTKQKDSVRVSTDAERFADRMTRDYVSDQYLGPMWFDVLSRIRQHNRGM